MKIILLILIYRSYKCCVTIELIKVTKLILPKVITVKNVLSVTIAFMIVALFFKILFVMVVIFPVLCLISSFVLFIT